MQQENKIFLLGVWIYMFLSFFLHNVFLYKIEEKAILCFIRLDDIFFQDPVVSSIFSKLCATFDCSL